jgi:hypothetical protein
MCDPTQTWSSDQLGCVSSATQCSTAERCLAACAAGACDPGQGKDGGLDAPADARTDETVGARDDLDAGSPDEDVATGGDLATEADVPQGSDASVDRPGPDMGSDGRDVSDPDLADLAPSDVNCGDGGAGGLATACSGICTNLMVDPNHCGRCGLSCLGYARPTSCNQGACVDQATPDSTAPTSLLVDGDSASPSTNLYVGGQQTSAGVLYRASLPGNGLFEAPGWSKLSTTSTSAMGRCSGEWPPVEACP